MLFSIEIRIVKSIVWDDANIVWDGEEFFLLEFRLIEPLL